MDRSLMTTSPSKLEPQLFGSQIKGVLEVLEEGCKDHPKYLGLRKPRVDCKTCQIIYAWRDKLL